MSVRVVGITGSSGLIGFHLRALLHTCDGITFRCSDRAVFDDAAAMDRFLDGVDTVVHLAYINRGSADEVGEINLQLARRLVAGSERSASVRQIIFSSSTHIKHDTVYGRSKRDCAAIFRRWADAKGGDFSNIIFPHVFGEYGRPFANSVVSTFCYQLANDERPVIEHDGELQLLHAGEAGALIHRCIEEGADGDMSVPGERIRVSEVLARLSDMAASYEAGIIPYLHDPLSLRLFNNYRSYRFPGHYPVSLARHEDERGSLFEAVKTKHGGQAFLSTTRPGIVRGNHFHFHKLERFIVLQGEAVVALRRIFSNEVVEFRVSGNKPQFIDIPTLHIHNITNVGDAELITLFWAHEIFNAERPDTFAELVYRDNP